MNLGKIITTRPLPLDVVVRIKEHLKDNPRDLAWFCLSINSAFRGGDVLRIKRSDVRSLPGGKMEIAFRERKTKKIRTVRLNAEVAKVISRWLLVHPQKTEYLFEGARGRMGTAWMSVCLRKWCEAVGYDEKRTATHSLRKAFARTNYERGARVETLMVALRHSTPLQTLTYINILPEEIEALYEQGI